MALAGLRWSGLRGAAGLLEDYKAFAGRRLALAIGLMLGGALAEGRAARLARRLRLGQWQ
jgi:hypothetical protein